MQDTTIETIDSPNDTEITVNDSANAEQKLLALEEQNKKLYARAKKAEGFVQDSDGNWVKKEPKPQATISEERQSIPKPSDILKADEFKLYRAGYSESEIDLIMHNGGMKALDDEKSPLTLGLKVAREQRTAEDASNMLSDKSGMSEVERKYTPEQMRNMKPADLANLIGFAPER
jgi:hypothetical protein